MKRDRFLVSYDYGQGAVWAYVLAESKAAIVQRYPDLVTHDGTPSFLSPSDLERIASTMTIDISDADHPFLRKLPTGRSASR